MGRKLIKPREKTASEIMIAFKDAAKSIAEDFEKKFPVGTFVKTWHKGQGYDTVFCYVASKPMIYLDESLFSDFNMNSFLECQKDGDDASCVFWYYVPIDLKDNRTWNKKSHSFGICKNRFVEKSSIEEYKEYMLDRFNNQIKKYKEEIKTLKGRIKENKKSIYNIDQNLNVAVQFLDDNFKKETEI